MIESRQIVERWRQGSALVLVTLIRVQGSSYRQPGARFMICQDRSYEGSLSAGCLEADLARKAAWLIRDGATVKRYSTLFDENAEIPFGLGCGGVLDVLLEAIGTPECEALLNAVEASLSGLEHLVATWVPKGNRSMMRAIFRTDGELVFASNALSKESLAQARMKCLFEPNLEIHGVVVERLAAPQRLFIFGAGDDAKPLVAMAGMLGWRITVIDGRAHFALRSRFPENKVELFHKPKAALEQLSVRDAVVIMTHSYEQDREYLVSVLPTRPRYLGLLGSRQRSSLLIEEAAARLEMSVSECCDQICAPIGLDIGGDGPEVIALAILAEAQARCAGRGKDSRKLSAERVRSYASDVDARTYLESQCSLHIA